MKSIMVTGASSGIGRATVDDLVQHGFHVWASVRSDEDEKALLTAHPQHLEVLRLDLADAGSIAAAGERVCAAGPLHGLVNNAGIALPGPLEYVPIDVFRQQIEINVVAQLAVTQAVMPALRSAKQTDDDARIVMIGSIGGRIAGPMLGGYHASKFALVGLSDSLRAELSPWGIKVILVEPGAIATAIWQRGRASGDAVTAQMPESASTLYARQIAGMRANAARSAKRGLPPERVARSIREALTTGRPRARYLVGPDAHVAALITRLSARLARRLTAARA
jgi:NAD(P)-dependent dehydrogenase (short-subunit alcohol dehydrogenase family)